MLFEQYANNLCTFILSLDFSSALCVLLYLHFFFFVSKIDVLHARSWRGVGNVFNKILLIYQKKKIV